MRISRVTIIVKDQKDALHFYTDVLGFVKKSDIAEGERRRLTVVSPLYPDGPELVLEQNDNPAAATYQRALFYAGLPMVSFEVPSVQAEHDRLAELGVAFSIEPGGTIKAHVALFNDTCGNLVQIYEDVRTVR